MKIIIVTLVFIGLAVVQIVGADLMSVRGVRPDLLLIAAVFCCLRAGWQRGLLLGMLAGFVYDMLTVGRIGLFTVSFGLCGAVLGLFTYQLYFENPLTQSLLVLCVTLVHAAIFFTLSSLLSSVSLWNLYMCKVIPQSVYNFAVALVLYMIMRRFERKRLLMFS